jgi:hypothetical protein
MNPLCSLCGNPVVIGDWPWCPHGIPASRGDAQIHTSEKVTVMQNPQTGEVRIPGRGDRAIHPKYAAAGFELKTIDSIPQLRQLEKTQGLVHERSHYDSGSVTAERDTGSV